MKYLFLFALSFLFASQSLAYDLSAPESYRLKDLFMYHSGGEKSMENDGQQVSAAICYGPFYEIRNGENVVGEILNFCPGITGNQQLGGNISGGINIELLNVFGMGFGIGYDPENTRFTYGGTFSFTGISGSLPDRPDVDMGPFALP